MSRVVEEAVATTPPAAPPPPPGTGEEAGSPPARTIAGGSSVVLGSGLSAAAAAWMASSIFRDPVAHLIALGGVALGAGLVLAAQRFRRASWLEYAVVPLAVMAGVVLVAPDAPGGVATFTSVVADAVKSGGLLQPPIPFDPGWRFILVVFFALLAAGSAKLGTSLSRPKIGVALPVPVTLAAAVIQPPSAEIVSVAVAAVLVIVGLTLGYGEELRGSGSIAAGFEGRRLLRGGAQAAAIAALLIGLGQLSFLFPQPTQHNVIPPQKPPPPPPVTDHLLFSYKGNRQVPLRMGVIDVYDPAQKAWLLPPFDTSRLQRLQPPADVPGAPPAGRGAVVVQFTIHQFTGHALPAVASVGEVKGTDQAVDYDPRTNALSLADRPAYDGLQYSVEGPPIPSGKQLAAAGPPPPSMSDFLTVPAAPEEVTALLHAYSDRAAKQKQPEDAFDRLQFMRLALYQKIVAAGPGVPKDVPASRVAAMLRGGDASPYEIAAAEALLARWAGVPSRIGYGYDGGEKQKDGSYDVHPVDGAMWLEAYFDRYGWVPIVGVPPKAKASSSQSIKNRLNAVAADRLQLLVLIPVEVPTVQYLFELVRWWLVRVVPVLAIVGLAYAFYPWLLKILRRRRRRRWAARRGEAGRIAVAYAEFRDRARDLTIGDPSASPIGFLRYVADDREHRELAWLTSRALWGDLRRDLLPEDAAAAERLARSVTKRVDQAQPGLDRLLARAARTSLREPYSTEVPNLWPRFGGRLHLPRPTLRRRGRRHALAAATLTVLLVAVSCGAQAIRLHPRPVPAGMVPDKLGAFTFHREKAAEKLYRTAGSDALVTSGEVFTIHHSGITDGAVEVAVFKPAVDISDISDESRSVYCTDNPVECPGHEIFMGMQQNLGSGEFQRVYFRGYERVYRMVLRDQRIYMWFPPHSESMVTLILIGEFPASNAEALMHALLDYEHNQAPQPVPVPTLNAASPSPTPDFFSLGGQTAP